MYRARPNRTHPQRQQPSTEQAIETQRELPFEVQLPQCTTEHARHAEDRATRMLQFPWPDDLEGRFNSFHIRSAYATGDYWASFFKAKALRSTFFESFSAIAHVLQRFLVGDSDFRYFDRYFEDGSCHTTFFTSLIVTPWAAPPIDQRSLMFYGRCREKPRWPRM